MKGPRHLFGNVTITGAMRRTQTRLRIEGLQLGHVQPRPVARATTADAQHTQLRQTRPAQLLGALRPATRELC